MMKRPIQGELPLWRGRWGGARPKAGRPPLNNGRVPHLPRKDFGPRYPWLVTLRVREGMSSLRTVAVVRAVEDGFRRMRGREGFRLTHYSIQGNHLHAIVEATDADALGRGMMSLGIRFARAVNRALRRKGPVVWDRYHARVLKSPTQVRNAIRYVLLNVRRHAAQGRKGRQLAGTVRFDPASSARWFEGWKWRSREEGEAARASPPAVSRPRTWLLARGWSFLGGLDPSDVPGRV